MLAQKLSDALSHAARPYVQLGRPTVDVAPTETVGLATVGHSPEQITPRRSVARLGDVIVCIDGLPVEPQGRFPAWNAEALLSHWDEANSLEGQFAALRVDLGRSTIECLTDALGLGPVYVQRNSDGWVVATSVAAIHALAGADDADALGVASFLMLGWAAWGDRTLRSSVRAVRGGAQTTFTAEGESTRRDFTQASRLLMRGGRRRTTWA